MRLTTSNTVWAGRPFDIIDAACCWRLVDRSCIIRIQKSRIIRKMIVFRDLLYRKSHSLLSFFSPQRISIGSKPVSDANLLGSQVGAETRSFAWDYLPSEPALATWQTSFKAVVADAGAANLYGVNNKWTGADLPLSVVQPSLRLNQIIKI